MEDIYFDILVWKEESVYISYCPQFDVSSCGNTVEEARRMLKEAVHLFVEGAEELGTLQAILEESGFHLEESESDRKWQPPRLVATELMSVSTGR
jgi:predicted RNase H-like HicB family nuclease